MYGRDRGSRGPGEPGDGGQGSHGQAGADRGLRLSRLESQHLAACQDLDAAALGQLWSAAQWQAELADGARTAVGLWQGDALVAMACGWLIVDELHITLVAVRPQQRRRGLGRQVLQALLAEGRSSGARAATLEVGEGNRAALGLYGALGFSSRGRRRDYYRNGEAALIQWLSLVEPARGDRADNTIDRCG